MLSTCMNNAFTFRSSRKFDFTSANMGGCWACQGIDREVGPVHYDLDSNCSDAQSRRSMGAEYMSDQEAAVPTDRQNNTNTEHGVG